MRFSVVIPNYNHAHFITETLASVAAQTRPADEIIVIDDASTDNSLEVIQSFQDRLPTMRVIARETRSGVVCALNQGLAAADADFLLFLGADDFIHRDFFHAAEKYLTQRPEAGLVCASVALIGKQVTGTRPAFLPSTVPAFIEPSGFRERLRLMDNDFRGTATLFRQAALRDIGGFDESLGPLSDSIAARRLAVRHGFWFLPEVLGYFRIHGANYSVRLSRDARRIDDIIGRVKTVIEQEPEGLFPEGYGDLLERRIRFGNARLVALLSLDALPEKAAVISRIVHASRYEAAMLAELVRAGKLGSAAILVWLTVKCRPFSFLSLASEPFRRQIAFRAVRQKPGTPTP